MEHLVFGGWGEGEKDLAQRLTKNYQEAEKERVRGRRKTQRKWQPRKTKYFKIQRARNEVTRKRVQVIYDHFIWNMEVTEDLRSTILVE